LLEQVLLEKVKRKKNHKKELKTIKDTNNIFVNDDNKVEIKKGITIR